MVSLRIDGLKELSATLNQLSVRVRRKVLTEVLAEAAEPMRRTASRLAPHDPGTPDLRANIIVQRKDRTLEDGELVKQGEFQATVAIGPSKPFFYGGHQEFGTVRHGAQPFMRPAFDGETGAALRDIGERLWRELAGRGIQRPTIDAPSAPSGPGRTV